MSGDEILAYIPTADDLETGQADVDLIKGLCDLCREHVRPRNMMDLTRALRQRQRVTKDVVNLLHCPGKFCVGSDEAS